MPPVRAELSQSLQTAAQELLGSRDTASALAVCYYSGHGAVNSSGQTCMVTACGDLVPLAASLQPVLQPVRWSVLLVDAFRMHTSTGSDGAPGAYRIPFSTPQHYLVGNACADGITSVEGLFTEKLMQVCVVQAGRGGGAVDRLGRGPGGTHVLGGSISVALLSSAVTDNLSVTKFVTGIGEVCLQYTLSVHNDCATFIGFSSPACYRPGATATNLCMTW